MNTRAKGQRTERTAVQFALTFPHTHVLRIWQPPMFSKPQPLDMVIFRQGFAPLFVECRTNQWGVSKPQTIALSNLPGVVCKQIWMFKQGEKTPQIREWKRIKWMRIQSPWGENV